MIEDLRTLALSDAGALPLHKEPLAWSAVGRRSQHANRVHPQVGGLDRVCVNRQLADRSRPLRIREVLTNLLANALRHTGTGGAVTVSVINGRRVEIGVMDTGEGMPAEELRRMFDPSTRIGIMARGSD